MKWIEELKAEIAANNARRERNKKIRTVVLVLAALFFLFGPLAFMAFGQVPPVKDVQGGGRGYVPLTPEKRAMYQQKSRAAHDGRIAMFAKNLALPPTFDCRDKGWLLPTGDQGQCGSCYLYSTVYGTTSSAFVIAGYAKNDGSFLMSVQYGMDCHNFGGCNGGNGTEVIDWLCTHGWPAEKYVDNSGVAHNDYPAYKAGSSTCRLKAGAKLWKPATWGFVNANGAPSVDEIKAAMYKYGPINIALDAGGQFSNGTGTITSLGNSIDHEINCVGWDDNKQAFLLWNQWTTDWGTGGFRWCSYAASKHIVDWFWVSVDPLPPPPPPPPPAAVPVITSAGAIQVNVNVPFSYQITATNNPTGYSASGLPAGWVCSPTTGLITGTATTTGARSLVIAAANASGTGTANLVVTTDSVPVPPVPVGTATFSLSKDLKAGTYEVHKVGTQAAIDFLSGGSTAATMTSKEPPAIVPVAEDKNMTKLVEMMAEMQKIMIDQQRQIKEIQDKLLKMSKSPVTMEYRNEVYPSIRMHDADRISSLRARHPGSTPRSTQGEQWEAFHCGVV